jgi:hypothetical protein
MPWQQRSERLSASRVSTNVVQVDVQVDVRVDFRSSAKVGALRPGPESDPESGPRRARAKHAGAGGVGCPSRSPRRGGPGPAVVPASGAGLAAWAHSAAPTRDPRPPEPPRQPPTRTKQQRATDRALEQVTGAPVAKAGLAPESRAARPATSWFRRWQQPFRPASGEASLRDRHRESTLW